MIATPTATATARATALRIGPISVWPPVVLAPMAGVTNSSFRSLCRGFGAGLYVSQMITARAIVERHARTLELVEFGPEEAPRSVQLYGTDPRSIAQATRWLIEHRAVDHVDLNFGCPAKKVTRHGGGAALPFKRRLLGDIVGATVRAAGPVPVTVKFRTGVDAVHHTYLDAGRIAAGEGAAAVALHARSAEQLYSGCADWTAIARLKEHVTDVPVLGNGDIWEAGDALAMMRRTGCDGVVVGRGCLGRPWLFRELADAFDGRPVTPPPSLRQVVAVMTDHLGRLVASMGEHRGVRDFRKHTAWYLKGFEVGPALRRSLNQLESAAAMADLLAGLPDRPFPAAAARMPRGHTNGPRPVTLPHRWLDDPDEDVALGAGAESLVSGG